MVSGGCPQNGSGLANECPQESRITCIHKRQNQVRRSSRIYAVRRLQTSDDEGGGSMTESRGLKGGTVDLSRGILTARWAQLRGRLCLQGEAGYDEARMIWNAMIPLRLQAAVAAAAQTR